MKIVYADKTGSTTNMPPASPEKGYLLALDGSTSRSGICVMTLDGEFVFVCAVSRGTESVIEYKISLQSFIRSVIETYKITNAVYEEPFVGYANDAAGLYAIATILPELAVTIPALKVIGVANTRWKSKFIDKLQGSRSIPKAVVCKRAVEEIPALSVCKDDETDAYGLAVYFAESLKSNVQMESVSKPRPFKYAVSLYGGKPSIAELQLPKRKDGVIERDISHCRRFDAIVYELLNGKDAVLVLRFPVGKFGDMVLINDKNNAARGNDSLTAVVTRNNKPRKNNHKCCANTRQY